FTSLFTATATPDIYSLSLHDALPISRWVPRSVVHVELGNEARIDLEKLVHVAHDARRVRREVIEEKDAEPRSVEELQIATEMAADRKSTRLNSSHLGISYAVFCLKKK